MDLEHIDVELYMSVSIQLVALNWIFIFNSNLISQGKLFTPTSVSLRSLPKDLSQDTLSKHIPSP